MSLLALAPSAQASERLEAGKWESTLTIDNSVRTIAYCIKPDEAASINGDAGSAREFAERKAQRSGAPCAFKSYEIQGSTVSYTMICGTRTITDKTVYRGQSSEGVRTITKDGQTISMQINSRLIGACP